MFLYEWFHKIISQSNPTLNPQCLTMFIALNRSFQLIHDFFSAGLETTACTLTWAFCLIAKFQEVQEKVKVCKES